MRFTFFLLFISVGMISCHQKTAQPNPRTTLINYPEIEQNFIKAGDTAIFFVQTFNQESHLCKYKDGKVQYLITAQPPLTNLFNIGGQLSALRDSCGNEQYTSLNNDLGDRIGTKKIERIYSDPTGKYLVYKSTNQNVYLFNCKTLTEQQILSNTENFQQLSYAHNDSLATFVEEGKLYILHLTTGKVQEIETTLSTEKLNPSFADQEIYFCSRDTSDFTRIYKIKYTDPQAREQLVFQVPEHDLRMPIKDGDNLYYLHLQNSMYLLCRLNLKTRSVEYITTSGVVYTYQFLHENLIYSYSDEHCAKSLLFYNTKDHRKNFVLPQFTPNDFNNLNYQNKDQKLYNISSNKATPNNITILYIHPGIHSDFSPRYDPILASLAHLGYNILAPNFPGSIGYGERYKNQSQDSAVEYLNNLKKQQLQEQPKSKIMILSQSSGNTLAEKLISKYPSGIIAAASVFGTSSGFTPDFNTPYLYLLAENDPIVNYTQRNDELKQAKHDHKNIQIHSYPAEGHWFRNPANLEDAVNRINNFYNCH